MNLDDRMMRAAEEAREATRRLHVPEMRRPGLRRWIGAGLALAGASAVILIAVLLLRPGPAELVPPTTPDPAPATTPTTAPAPELIEDVTLLPLGPEPEFTLPGTLIPVEWTEPAPEEVASLLAGSSLEGTGYGTAGKAGVPTVLVGPSGPGGTCVIGGAGDDRLEVCIEGGFDDLVVDFYLDPPERTNDTPAAATTIIRGRAAGTVGEGTALATIQVGGTTFTQRPRGRVVWLPVTFGLADTPQLRLYSVTGDVLHSAAVTSHHEFVAAQVVVLQRDAEAALAGGSVDASQLAELRGRLGWLQDLVRQLPSGDDASPAILTDVDKTIADIERSLREAPVTAPVSACVSLQQYLAAYQRALTEGADQQAGVEDMRTHASDLRRARPDLAGMLDVTLGWATAFATDPGFVLTDAERATVESADVELEEEVDFCSDPTIFIHSAGASAIAGGGELLWVATRDLYRGEGVPPSPPAVMAIEPDSNRIVAAYEVGAPMYELAVTLDSVWFARAGDGAEPDNVIGRVDVASGTVEEVVLSSGVPDGVVDIVVVGRRAYAVMGNPEDPRILVFDEAVEQIGSIEVPGGELRAAVLAGERLLVAEVAGTIWSVDPATGTVEQVGRLGAWVADLHRVETGDPAGATWARMNDEQGSFVRAFADDGAVIATYEGRPGDTIRSLATRGPDAFVVYESGVVEFLPLSGDPQVVGEAEGRVAVGGVLAGTDLWVITEAGLERVPLGQ